jgi:hypothetical protein
MNTRDLNFIGSNVTNWLKAREGQRRAQGYYDSQRSAGASDEDLSYLAGSYDPGYSNNQDVNSGYVGYRQRRTEFEQEKKMQELDYSMKKQEFYANQNARANAAAKERQARRRQLTKELYDRFLNPKTSPNLTVAQQRALWKKEALLEGFDPSEIPYPIPSGTANTRTQSGSIAED